MWIVLLRSLLILATGTVSEWLNSVNTARHSRKTSKSNFKTLLTEISMITASLPSNFPNLVISCAAFEARW